MDFEDKGTDMGAFVKFWVLKRGLFVKNLGAKVEAIFQFWPGGYPKKLYWQLWIFWILYYRKDAAKSIKSIVQASPISLFANSF